MDTNQLEMVWLTLFLYEILETIEELIGLVWWFSGYWYVIGNLISKVVDLDIIILDCRMTSLVLWFLLILFVIAFPLPILLDIQYFELFQNQNKLVPRLLHLSLKINNYFHRVIIKCVFN